MVPTRMNATTATSPFLAPSGETDKTLNLMSFRTEQSFQRFCGRQDNYLARCYSGSDGKSVEKDCLRAEGEKAAKSEQKGSRRSGQKITLSSVFIAFDNSIFSPHFVLCCKEYLSHFKALCFWDGGVCLYKNNFRQRIHNPRLPKNLHRSVQPKRLCKVLLVQDITTTTWWYTHFFAPTRCIKDSICTHQNHIFASTRRRKRGTAVLIFLQVGRLFPPAFTAPTKVGLCLTNLIWCNLN